MIDPIRVLIAGSRRVPRADEPKIRAAIERVVGRHFGDTDPEQTHKPVMVDEVIRYLPRIVLVHGDCPEPKADHIPIADIEFTSIDQIARRLGEEVYDGQEPHPADWDQHGKAAGPIRTKAMVDSGPDFGIILPGGTGTQRAVEFLFRARISFEFVVPS